MKKLSRKVKSKTMLKAGVFIDDANIFFAQKKAGWKLDLHKLKKMLAKELDIKLGSCPVNTV